MAKKEFKRGQALVNEGDPVTSFYIILNGEFEMSKRMAAVHKAKTSKVEGGSELRVSGQESNLEAMIRSKQARQ
jgi:CRP-like cAMP-binding protein